ncbi:protein ELYS isoform X2 [Acipenser ruthenus]|uniref:protein ELYS isoform X2 n=1 Tax=Acipenser ruthenus TaxID=7906 RepID=UPI00274058E9|nr:protein ELYS isoform X2 [Acipenser ruthenus]
MCDLTAQVISSLRQFPEVTVEALGEDEIKLDSVLHGKFATGKNGLAWLACGPQLEVVSSATGERLSAYRFSSVGENPPNILAAKEFCWLKRTGLLVGLEETEGSMLCLYDLGISRVVKAVLLPGRITAIEPLINHGGASASTQHLHQSLRWFFGAVAVVTDVGHVLLIDLCLDDLSCSQSELEASGLKVVNKAPAEIPRIRETATREGRHLCLQLQNPSGNAATAVQYLARTNQLAVGFSDGCLQLWNMKSFKKEYHSQLEGGRVSVHALMFQEPENDPRNCCYLWAVQSAQDSEGDVVSLHLLQLAFGDKKCLASGQILYEGLEYCEERYSQDLTGGVFSLRAQATSTRLLGCQTIENFRNHPDRDESMNDVSSPDTSVAIFSWQVKSYGQGKPSTYLGVFDINRWYHAQMPDSLRTGEFLHNCSYFALWSLDAVTVTSPNPLLDILVHERSLSRGLPPTSPPPEQFFYPSTYNFDATCLLDLGIVHLTCSGFQKETLSFLKKSGPCLSEAIPDGYSRCLMAGLLSPRLADVQPSSLTQEEQLEAILSTVVKTSSFCLITGCIKQWTREEQPRSGANLRFVLEWAWNKLVRTKDELDSICAPLFSSSCNFIDPQTLQAMQHCQLLLGNLNTIFNCFLSEAQELTEKGLVDLTNKHVVANLIFQYAQVVLWFCRSGLLPEGADVLQISKPCYNYPEIQNYYNGRRQKLERLSRGKWSSNCLMIDGMVAQFGDRIEKVWKRDEGGTGRYPPPTLHALLDIYLLESAEESAKHAIVIYLLLDVLYSFSNKPESSVESFPTAFAIPLGLVKLIQGFWLLDHNDHETALDLILHPTTSRSMLSWQHARIIQALMCQGEHRQALRYIQMMKPSMSTSSEIKLYLTVFLFNRCMVEAWSLLRQHSSRLNVEDLLKHMYEMCQEMGLMEDLLKLPFTVTEQECLEKFLQSNGDLQNQEFLMVYYLQRANYVPALQLNQTLKMNLMNNRDPQLKERTIARNSILDQYGKVLPRVQRRLATERAKPYHHPSTILREVSRPKPLSTMAKPAASGNILTRATFINNVLSKIGEVWVGDITKPDLSPFKSPKIPELPLVKSPPLSLDQTDAFVGTPITRTTKRISRLLDLVVLPTPEKSPDAVSIQQTPPKVIPSWTTSSPLRPSAIKPSYLKNVFKPSELTLLQTPPVVKRARALTSVASSFPGFTPHSILRSSQRPTPVGSPSASPGRSLTPPLRVKESRITFIEATTRPAQWSNGIAADNEINLLSATSSVLKSRSRSASPWSTSAEERVLFAPSKPLVLQLQNEGMAEEIPDRDASEDMQEVKEMSHISARSGDSTLEFHDAPTPEEFEDDVVIINAKPAVSVDCKPVQVEVPQLVVLEEEEEEEEEEEKKVSEVFLIEKQEERLHPEDENEVVEPPMEYKDLDNVDVPSTLTRASIRDAFVTDFHYMAASESEQKSYPLFEVVFGTDDSSDVLVPVAADTRSVVHVSEDVAPSENKPEDIAENGKIEEHVCLEEEATAENVECLEEGTPAEESGVCLEERTVDDFPVISEERQVPDHSVVEDPEPVSYTELQPTVPVLTPVQFSDTQHFKGELLEIRETNESEVSKIHDDLEPTPSSFSLILEAEDGENEMENAATEPNAHLLVVELLKVRESGDHAEEGRDVSEESEQQIGNQEAVTLVKAAEESPEAQIDIAESLPYVSEPIKMVIAENLLDAVKDTRTKEFVAELVDGCMQEEMLVTGKTVRSPTSKPLEEPIHALTDASIKEITSTLAENKQKSRCTRGKSVVMVEEQTADVQMLHPIDGEPLDQPDLQVPTTPRRAMRSAKHQPQTNTSATPGRTLRKTKDVKLEPDADQHQTTQPTTPRRGGRRTRSSIVEPVESIQAMDKDNKQEVTMTVIPTRRTRRTSSILAVSESALVDQPVKVSASPSRFTRKSIGVTLEIPQVSQQKDISTEHHKQMPLTPKRGRKSKSSLEQLKTATPRRATRSRLASLTQVPEDALPILENAYANELALQAPDTSKESTRLVETTETRESGIMMVEGTVSHHDEMIKEVHGTAANSRRRNTLETQHPSPDEAEDTRGLAELSSSDELHAEEQNIESNAGDSEKMDPAKATVKKARGHPRKVSDLPAQEPFVFTPPCTRLMKAKKPNSPEALSTVEPQFVSSPPATRTRRKVGITISRTVEEMDIHEVDNEVPKASKPMKKKASKAKKDVPWSPPPVEVNLISPIASPIDASAGKQKSGDDATSERRNLRRTRKRLMDTIFPKPVTRRKMP